MKTTESEYENHKDEIKTVSIELKSKSYVIDIPKDVSYSKKRIKKNAKKAAKELSKEFGDKISYRIVGDKVFFHNLKSNYYKTEILPLIKQQLIKSIINKEN